MKIENYHCIQSLELPPGWLEVKLSAEFAPRSVRAFAPAGETKVKMGLLSEGIPLDKNVVQAFREFLKSAPRVVFDIAKQDKLNPRDEQLIGTLRRALGHVGDNQIVNKSIGPSGPVFRLERLEAVVLNNRPVLAIRGWFCDPESEVRVNAYCGFFIEDNSNADECFLEQVYLQANSENLYLKNLSVFEKSMGSIKWAS